MNLSDIKKGPLKDVFDALEEAFVKNNTDFYLIGAQARDQWYAKDNLVARQTNDVDFAAFVSDVTDYQKLREYLKEHFGYKETKQNQFILLAPSGLQVDILPFGDLEIDDAINFKGEGLTSIKVNGFREIYENGTEEFTTDTGHTFEVASLPSIVLLKLIAFDDRPEKRVKDAIDVDNIVNYYFDLQSDNIYANHNELFLNEDLVNETTELSEISALVIGREINKIINGNLTLLDRVKMILQTHIEQAVSSLFIRSMINGDDTVAGKVKLLKNMLIGLTQQTERPPIRQVN
ncbi:MAG: nucleotidyl transferase AbiEii/AbiGii toxin family protein [Chitinophagaceae bacterium]